METDIDLQMLSPLFTLPLVLRLWPVAENVLELEV
jgi:hypothetical protein